MAGGSTDINDEENYIANWLILSDKLEAILHPESNIQVSSEELYFKVYQIVCTGFSESLHIDVISLCSRHLNRHVNQKLCGYDEISVEHLTTFNQALSGYCYSIKIISFVLGYLLRTNKSQNKLDQQLLGLFCQIVANKRIPTIMRIVEISLENPFSISPAVLSEMFQNLYLVSHGGYCQEYSHLFSKYFPNVLPPMQINEIEAHIQEVKAFQQAQSNLYTQTPECRKGVKRSAEDEIDSKKTAMLPAVKSNSLQTAFH